jgi:hypothetical protein
LPSSRLERATGSVSSGSSDLRSRSPAVVSTWFEGAIVHGIARVLYLIPETLGWLIGAL